MEKILNSPILRSLAAFAGLVFTERACNLLLVEHGFLHPEPSSRLGAFKATQGYVLGTVGNANHHAIGFIYLVLGSFAQEDIGSLFNSKEAKALYPDPAESDSSLALSQTELEQWKSKKGTIGGFLGGAFSAHTRQWILIHVFFKDYKYSKYFLRLVFWSGTGLSLTSLFVFSFSKKS